MTNKKNTWYDDYLGEYPPDEFMENLGGWLQSHNFEDEYFEKSFEKIKSPEDLKKFYRQAVSQFYADVAYIINLGKARGNNNDTK